MLASNEGAREQPTKARRPVKDRRSRPAQRRRAVRPSTFLFELDSAVQEQSISCVGMQKDGLKMINASCPLTKKQKEATLIFTLSFLSPGPRRHDPTGPGALVAKVVEEDRKGEHASVGIHTSATHLASKGNVARNMLFWQTPHVLRQNPSSIDTYFGDLHSWHLAPIYSLTFCFARAI